MNKTTGKNRDNKAASDREDEVRRSLDEHGSREDTFDPRGGEDPGALELTEDPLERRLKRNTL